MAVMTKKLSVMDSFGSSNHEPAGNGSMDKFHTMMLSLEPLPNNPVTNRLCRISPEMAQFILDNFNTNNRPKKTGKIELFTQDMKNGRWKVTHQGIAFTDQGVLADGQNTLESIVRSGKPQVVQVFFGVPHANVTHIDMGTARSVADSAKIGGNEWVTKMHVATARRVYQSFQLKCANLSNPSLIEFVKKHKEAIAFALDAFPGKDTGVCVAPVLAVVARAYYTKDRDRIQQFCKRLVDGEISNPKEDGSVIRLRDFLYLCMAKDHQGSQAGSAKYRKTEKALDAFLKQEPLVKLTEAKEELFPLPGESGFPESE